MKPRGQASLFDAGDEARRDAAAPLAERMRPRRVEDVVGHDKSLGPETMLGRMLRGATPPRSLLLWGPPGAGKTTIARLLADRADIGFASLSAVLSGVRELRELLEEARERRRLEGRGTILFVDEIHRFNKAQQDAFLPHVERGDIVLVGATTENPSFAVNAPLLSRCRVVVLETLSSEDIGKVLDRAMGDRERGLGASGLVLETAARRFLAESAQGDARAALGTLEVAVDLTVAAGKPVVDAALAALALERKVLRHDADGEEHYNVTSAFIKSMRGGDPDATLYWLARMLEAGEDPLFVARRMIVFASEDIGLADNDALALAVAARDAVASIGMPEGRIPLAHVAVYLATAPKSRRAYEGIEAALAEIRASGTLPVPLHLRNAVTPLMRGLGYGTTPADEDRPPGFLPAALADRRFVPKPQRD